MKKNIFIDFAIPLATGVILTAVIYWTNGDMEIEKWFYAAGRGWFSGQASPWYFLYHYGNIPAISLCAAALVVFILSFFRQACLPFRKSALFLVVFLVLGPGLLVNTVLKDHWGRPRPADIVNFGGKAPFHQVWERGQAGQGKSFPSGHASVGFFLFAPYFILRMTSRKWAMFFLALGIFYGLLMGTGRMIQGGHFLSDVLWAGVLTYMTGIVLYYVFRLDREMCRS